MTNYNDGKWHRWAGEDMKPASVHPKSKIEYIWLSDNSNSGRHTLVAGDDENEASAAWRQILAFRVVKEYREPREWWVWEGGEGALIPSRKGAHGAFKIREVIE